MSNQDEELPQFPTREAMDKFNRLLNLHEDKYMQDWDIELADSNRVNEFLECYQNHAKTNAEKLTLMSLIIASFNDYFWENKDLTMWEKIKALLVADKKLFEPIFDYWSVWDDDKIPDPDPEHHFIITPLMREISENFN